MSARAEGRSFLETDSESMLEATAALGEQLEEALSRPLPSSRGVPENVVVFGMGGSGVAGAVLQAIAQKSSPVPVVAVRGYDCPLFVGRATLAICVSFSGETAETLSQAAEAKRRGARLVAVTSGGSLGELVSGVGDLLALPAGIPQPRAGIGAMVGLVLLAAEEAGILPGARREIESACRQLERRLPTLADGGGESANLARAIGRTIPLSYGSDGLGAVAAYRFKTQVNENAKAPAFSASLPELCHNELCGFGQHGELTRQVLTLVTMATAGEDERLSLTRRLVSEAVYGAVGAVVSLEGEGEGELASFFDLVAVGDFCSLHLAAREGVDPGPVPVLSELKARLRGVR